VPPVPVRHPYSCAILLTVVLLGWKEPVGRLEGQQHSVRFCGKENRVINNTSLKRGDRMNAKSVDTQFMTAMQRGLNCSPFEAQIMVEKVHELYGSWFDTSTTVQPGQIQISVVDASVPPGTPLSEAAQKLVTLTLLDKSPDIDIQQQQGIPPLRQRRLMRVCEEAFQQGGLLTLEDLALLFNCGLRTLVGDLAALRRQELVPPLRSTVKDIGRAVTHRCQIVSLWLEGQEYSDLARHTHHSVSAVAQYVEKFKRSVSLLDSGFDVATTAFLARLSIPLVEQFHRIHQSVKPVAHRQRELQNFLKKSRAGQCSAPQRRPS
jgi:uncharacterized protein DUF1670